jgi:hypothetical protein
MKKIIFVKILYYLLFVLIFLFALVVFFEITRPEFYVTHLRNFFYGILKTVNF